MVLLDIVKTEIDKGEDDLADWISRQAGFVICNHISPEIIGKYQEVLQYIQMCGLYKEHRVKYREPKNLVFSREIGSFSI